MCDINFQDYSVEELIAMRATIEATIGDKKRKEYNIMVNKVLSILEVMAEKFPYEQAMEYDDYSFDWDYIYKAISEYR